MKASNELKMTDILKTLKDSAQYGELKKSLATVQTTKAVAPALPKVVTDRMVRQAGYKQASEDISKWVPFLKALKEKETLSFPLNPNNKKVISTAAGLEVDFQPTTSLELEIEQ